MKVLFLDIDGVLNSTRTNIANGGYPMELHHTAAFDWTSIKLIQRLCDTGGIQVVLSSAWRLWNTPAEVSKAFGLPIIDRTGGGAGGLRGDEIQAWLDEHPEVTHYAILDDTPDMLESQQGNFVHTSPQDGLLWADFSRLCGLLDVSPFDGAARDRNWLTPATATKLWTPAYRGETA